MKQTSLANTLQDILRQAGEAHHALVERMQAEGKDVTSENANWHRFYAEYTAHRLAPYLCGLQCHVTSQEDRKVGPFDGGPLAYAMEPTPSVVVKGKWDADSIGRLFNCHDTGDC